MISSIWPPSSSPVPRRIARLMLSAGMLTALAAVIAVRSRGFMSGSPPLRAAIMISLIRRVKILPRLASSAPFLCLIVAHLEWPDMELPHLNELIALISYADLDALESPRRDHRIASKPMQAKLDYSTRDLHQLGASR